MAPDGLASQRARVSAVIIWTLVCQYITRPVTPLENRLCPTCKVVESEIHFRLDCPSYEPFREELLKKIDSVELYFKQLLPINKFLYLTSTSNEQILKWFGKFIYLSLNKMTNIAK